jgi:cell division protein ZapE
VLAASDRAGAAPRPASAGPKVVIPRLLFGKREQAGAPLKGLYVYGEVGRGKTMLMDLFFETSAVVRKRRVHFHEFMDDVHERVHVFRQEIKNGEASEHDPIQRAAAAIAEESWLLCFDEFHITDIADAMIIGRLFTRLFELGVVMVATSNLAPGDLYSDGLNRALFLPFIALLERQCKVVRLEARVDFRLEKLTGMPTWYVRTIQADAAFDDAWRRLAAYAGAPRTGGERAYCEGTAGAMEWPAFSFADLCAAFVIPQDRTRIPHHYPRPYSGDGLQPPQRGQRHYPDRYALRPRG